MIKRTMPYISDELNREIGELMDMLDVDEMDVLIKKPVPMELRMSFWKGYNKKVWLFCERKWYYEEKTVILTKNIFFGIIDILYYKGDNQMFNNEQDFEEWRVDCLNKAKEILTMDKEKENNRSKKIETTANDMHPKS